MIDILHMERFQDVQNLYNILWDFKRGEIEQKMNSYVRAMDLQITSFAWYACSKRQVGDELRYIWLG